MKLSPRIFVWFQALVIIGCFSALNAQTQPSTYVASAVDGTVTWTDPVTKVVAPLTSGTSLPQGAILTTGAESSVTLFFSSGASLTLSENSTMEVSRFSQQSFTEEAFADVESEPSVSSTELNLIRGVVTGEVRRLRTGSEFVVNTPVGAAGVRGTVFSVSYDAVTKELTVRTSTGLVVVITPDGTNYSVGNDQKVRITDGDNENATVEDLTPVEKAVIDTIAQLASIAAAAAADLGITPPSFTLPPITVKDPDEVSGSQL